MKSKILRRVLLLAVVIIPQISFAQQEPLYTQYMFNLESVNPGYIGTRDAITMTAIHRDQWNGLNGAPKTSNFSLHSPINNFNMGLGLSVTSETIGYQNNTWMNVGYSYRVQLSESLTLSMGLTLGLHNFKVALTDMVVTDPDDPNFAANQSSGFTPNGGLGMFLYSNKCYVGLSVPSLFSVESEDSYGNSYTSKPHYFLIAGVVLNLTEKWKFRPSIMSKITQGSPLSQDLVAQFLYNDKLWLGASYRIGDEVGMIFNYRFDNSLMVGYSYDMTTSELSGYSKGSHEIMLSYDLDWFKKKKVKSPRYF